jgi:hypothetical protein
VGDAFQQEGIACGIEPVQVEGIEAGGTVEPLDDTAIPGWRGPGAVAPRLYGRIV